jgi:hypothetical protein
MSDCTLFDRFLETGTGRATAPDAPGLGDKESRREALAYLAERYPAGGRVLPDIDLNFNSDTSDAVRDFIARRITPEGPTS